MVRGGRAVSRQGNAGVVEQSEQLEHASELELTVSRRVGTARHRLDADLEVEFDVGVPTAIHRVIVRDPGLAVVRIEYVRSAHRI
jgi:hypothetical protein